MPKKAKVEEEPTTMYLLLPASRMMPDTNQYKPYGIEYRLDDPATGDPGLSILVEIDSNEVISVNAPIEFEDQRYGWTVVAYKQAILTPSGMAKVAIQIAEVLQDLHWASQDSRK